MKSALTVDETVEKRAINTVVGEFFAAFTNVDDSEVDLSNLRALFVPGCVIVKTCGLSPSVYSLEEFITPRQKLLGDGQLVNFSEAEVWEKTFVFGSIAQRFCSYRKSGVQCGDPFDAMGMKSIQLVKTEDGWKISSVIWDDERDGVVVPPKYTSADSSALLGASYSAT
jgi:hypothetical protein